jgi:hypothetical protein
MRTAEALSKTRSNLAILEKDMTREQKAEATKLAREFFEQLTKTK